MLDSPQHRGAMKCHLLVPNLFWPTAAGTEHCRGIEAPALEAMLTRGTRSRTAGASLERWLAAAWHLPAALPLAPYTLRGDGIEPGDDCWIRADPVHLRVYRDRLVLADTAQLHITPDEARELTEALRAHFATEKIAIVAPHPERWYLQITGEPGLYAQPTAEVVGRSIEPFLPAGEGGARWRRLMNEAQMLLHEHPRNAEREARNGLPVNSIWLWGAGRARQLTSPYGAIWSDHPLVIGLAAASGVTAEPLPASGTELPAVPSGLSALIVLSSLPATAYGDVPAWRSALEATERDWFAPLLARIGESSMNSLTLHGLGPDFGYVTDYRARDRYRFWRRNRPLSAYAA